MTTAILSLDLLSHFMKWFLFLDENSTSLIVTCFNPSLEIGVCVCMWVCAHAQREQYFRWMVVTEKCHMCPSAVALFCTGRAIFLSIPSEFYSWAPPSIP